MLVCQLGTHVLCQHVIGSLGADFKNRWKWSSRWKASSAPFKGLKKSPLVAGSVGLWNIQDMLWLGVRNGVWVQDMFSLHSINRNKHCVGHGWWHRPEICIDEGKKGKPGLYMKTNIKGHRCNQYMPILFAVQFTAVVYSALMTFFSVET